MRRTSVVHYRAIELGRILHWFITFCTFCIRVILDISILLFSALSHMIHNFLLGYWLYWERTISHILIILYSQTYGLSYLWNVQCSTLYISNLSMYAIQPYEKKRFFFCIGIGQNKISTSTYVSNSWIIPSLM